MLVVSLPYYVNGCKLMIVLLKLEVSCPWLLVVRGESTLLSGSSLEMSVAYLCINVSTDKQLGQLVGGAIK